MSQVQKRKSRSDKGKKLDKKGTKKIKRRIPKARRELLEQFPEYKGLEEHPLGTIVRVKNYMLAKIFEADRDIKDKVTNEVIGSKRVRKLVFVTTKNLPEIVEDMIKQSYLNVIWPKLDDPDFQKKIQKIFFDVGIAPETLSRKIDKDACFRRVEELQLNYYQRMIGFYLAYTPEEYRGLLVWHGLGSGKTCSSIDVIDRYIDRKLRERDIEDSGGRYNKFSSKERDITKPKKLPKIFIVTPPVAQLEENFRGELKRCPSIIKEAIRVRQEDLRGRKETRETKRTTKEIKIKKGKKELPKSVTSGLEHILTEPLSVEELAIREGRQSSKVVNTIINRYVTFLSYIKFANRIKLHASHKDHVDLEDSLIIMDEAHNILNPEPKDRKKYSNVIKGIRKTNSVKICLLSATPIFSRMSDLTRLVNILKHADQETLPESEGQFMRRYFDNTGGYREGEESLQLKQEIFKDDIQGLVSFFNDPDPNFFAPIDNMAKQVSVVSRKHEEKWERSFKNEVKGYGKFDFSKGNVRETHKFFNPKRGYFVQSSRITNIPTSFIKEEVWPEKFEELLKNISRFPKQKHFVISRHKANGANAIGTFLESNGWFRVSDNRKDHGTHPPAFTGDLTAQKIGTLIRTSRSKSPETVAEKKIEILKDFGGKEFSSFAVLNDNSLVREIGKVREFYNIFENQQGKYLRVLVVDHKFSEGMSLMNVQNVHIFDPFFSKQGEEQAIARARRFCSHKEQPFKERRIKVWKYFARGGLREQPSDGNDQGQKQVRGRRELSDDLLEDYADDQQKVLKQVIDVASDGSIDSGYLSRVKDRRRGKVSKIINTLFSAFQKK